MQQQRPSSSTFFSDRIHEFAYQIRGQFLLHEEQAFFNGLLSRAHSAYWSSAAFFDGLQALARNIKHIVLDDEDAPHRAAFFARAARRFYTPLYGIIRADLHETIHGIIMMGSCALDDITVLESVDTILKRIDDFSLLEGVFCGISDEDHNNMLSALGELEAWVSEQAVPAEGTNYYALWRCTVFKIRDLCNSFRAQHHSAAAKWNPADDEPEGQFAQLEDSFRTLSPWAPSLWFNKHRIRLLLFIELRIGRKAEPPIADGLIRRVTAFIAQIPLPETCPAHLWTPTMNIARAVLTEVRDAMLEDAYEKARAFAMLSVPRLAPPGSTWGGLNGDLRDQIMRLAVGQHTNGWWADCLRGGPAFATRERDRRRHPPQPQYQPRQGPPTSGLAQMSLEEIEGWLRAWEWDNGHPLQEPLYIKYAARKNQLRSLSSP